MPRLLCILLLTLVFAFPLHAADLEWDIEVGIDDARQSGIMPISEAL